MGRPIDKLYIGTQRSGSDAGGEGVASVAVNGANSYSAGTTITFGSSPIGGTTATASITFVTPADGAPGNGNVSGVTITEAGTGYLSAPAVTFSKPGNVVVDGVTGVYGNVIKFSSNVSSSIYVGMVANAFFTSTHLGNPTRVIAVDTDSGNITFSMGNTSAISSPVSLGDVGRGGAITATLDPAVTTANTIQANAWVTGGGSGRISDIVAQKGARRYRVTNDEGTSTVRLVLPTEVAAANAASGPHAEGLATITATDSDSGTYWVTKLDGRTATVTPGGSAPGAQFTANAQVQWTVNTAVASTSVKIATNN